MKTYRGHNCDRRHRTWTTHARCIWPRAEWIHGNGPHATLARYSVLQRDDAPTTDRPHEPTVTA